MISRNNFINNNIMMLYCYVAQLLSQNWVNFEIDFFQLNIYYYLNNELITKDKRASLLFIILLALLKFNNTDIFCEISIEKAYRVFSEPSKRLNENDIRNIYLQTKYGYEKNSIFVLKITELVIAICFIQQIKPPSEAMTQYKNKTLIIWLLSEVYSINDEHIIELICKLKKIEKTDSLLSDYKSFIKQN